ncbi:MAG: DNA primase [Thermomicrobiales bacterium]
MPGGTIETVKERTDVVDLIGAKVPLRQAGRGFKGLCPFHNEKTPSFVVYPESQSYHCFGCGKSGDIFTFIMDTEHLDFRDALKLLADRAGVQLESQIQQRRDPERDREREHLIELNERAAAFFSNILWTSPAAGEARAVLERRGVDRRTAERFGIGYAPDSFDALKGHFLARDIREADLVAAGLLTLREEDGRTWDRFRNRITFPIRNRDGKAVGFGARALGDAHPKYLNTAQTTIFDKRSLLYALDKAYDAVRRLRSIVIVEGYMDVIAAHQHGYENVVASMGTALTPTQVASIRRYVDRVYLALDSDAAGQLATLRGIESMRESFADDQRVEVLPGNLVRFERTLGAEIRVVLLPQGKDPDDFIRADPAAWPAALEASIPLVEYFLTRSLAGVDDSPSARARALQEVAVPILREIGDPVVLSHYVAMTARLLKHKDTEVHAAVLRGASRRPDARVPSRPSAMERPSAHDPERYLVTLLLRYPQATLDHLAAIDREDVLDTRHRLLIDALAAAPGDIDLALSSVDEDIAAYARSLLAESELRGVSFPLASSREIPVAIQRLAQMRYDARLRHVQSELQTAYQAGDSVAVAEYVQRLNLLAERKQTFAPRESPYFRDIRSTVG